MDECNLLSAKVVINPKAKLINEHRHVDNINLSELAILSDETASANDIVVRKTDGGLSEIADTHRSYNPLHFVLLFPIGSDVWRISRKLQLTESDHVKPMC